MKRAIVFSMLLLIIAAVSGCIFSSDDSKDGKKGTVSGKVSMVITGESVANVKVMLANKDAKIDMVNYENNRKAFVDSAVTDAAGNYSIGNIAPGNYGVVPVNEDTTSVYKFSFAAGSDSTGFAMNGETRTVNFTAEKMDYPGAIGDPLYITMHLEYNDLNPYRDKVMCTISQRVWVWFIPFFTGEQEFWSSFDYTVHFSQPKGFTLLLYTLDNCFKITMHDSQYNNPSVVIGFPLGSTPTFSEFSYNFDTKVLKRIK